MIQVQDIIAKSPLFPEFRFKENVTIEDPKTGKIVVGFYKITYEKLNPEVASTRMKDIVAREKAQKAQEKKDTVAAKRREKRRGRA